MDIAIAHYQDRIVELIAALGGISAVFIQPRCPVVLPQVSPFMSFQLSPDPVENELEAALRLTNSYESDPIRQRCVCVFLYCLQLNQAMILNSQTSLC